MPRFRSLSTNTPPPRTSPAPSGTTSPALLTRGFRSLRRARRQSNSVPSSPMPAASQSTPRSTTSSSTSQQQQQHQLQQQNQLLQQPNTIPLQQYNSAPMSSASSSISSSGPSTTHHMRNNSDSAASHHNSNQNHVEQQQQQQQQQQTNSTHGPHIKLVPNVGIGNRCFVFEIIDRTLEPGIILKIGRYSDRNVAPDRLSFKSKVVSRSHAELWVPADNNNKIYIRDVGSSSGTFVNRARLSPAGVRSSAQEVKDGDLIQLGVDYQGGIEPMYRAVRIRLEVNREPTVSHPFSRAAFQQLRSHLLAAVAPTTAAAASRHNNEEEVVVDHAQPFPNTIRARQPHTILLEDHSDHSDDDNGEDDFVKAATTTSTATTHKLLQHQQQMQDQSSPHTTTVRGSPVVNQSDIQECCICLYAIAPFQALFIAPCSHIFHFKCLRPILFQNYPGFSCPICRTYSDLEASVAVEVSEVLETLGLSSSAPPKVEGGDHGNTDEHSNNDDEEEEEHHHPLRTYATVHGDGRHASSVISEESSGHHRQPSSSSHVVEEEEDDDHHGQAESEEGAASAARRQPPGGLSVPTRASSQRNAHHHGDGLLSTTLVATPPTFEEMLTASSMSPTHR